jgi:hypothetical protein
MALKAGAYWGALGCKTGDEVLADKSKGVALCGYVDTYVTAAENSTGILIICYINFLAITFLLLSSSICYRVMRRGRRLTPSPMNKTLSRILYTLYYTSHIHFRILSVLEASARCSETKDCSLVRNLLQKLSSRNC